MKDSSNLRVDVNQQVVLLCQLFVSILDPITHPVAKRIFNEREQKVYQPLSGSPLDFRLVGKILQRSRVLLSLLVDVYKTQAFILGAKKVSDVIALDNCKGVNKRNSF